jgi:soluble lytic murein transglycosylase-like protein
MGARRQNVSPKGTAQTARLVELLLVLALLLPAAYAQSQLDGIMAVKDEQGRTVFVNAPKLRESTSAARGRSSRASVLVYWSSKEGAWKPVPPPSPAVMRAARQAASEVAGYVRSQPALDEPRLADTSGAPGATLNSSAPDQDSTMRAARRSYNAQIEAALRAPASRNPNYQRLAHGRAVTADEIDDAITRAAARHGVDPNLVRAVIKVESNFDPRAVSKKGAMGLMQLMPETARRLNVENPFDPQQNVDAGVRHLKNLLSSYHGDVQLSLAAYNAGETAVSRANGVPRFAETRNYVKQITGMYWNGVPVSTAYASREPIRVFRDGNGVLKITNE